jgi:hypothetical protein
VLRRSTTDRAALGGRSATGYAEDVFLQAESVVVSDNVVDPRRQLSNFRPLAERQEII